MHNLCQWIKPFLKRPLCICTNSLSLNGIIRYWSSLVLESRDVKIEENCIFISKPGASFHIDGHTPTYLPYVIISQPSNSECQKKSWAWNKMLYLPRYKLTLKGKSRWKNNWLFKTSQAQEQNKTLLVHLKWYDGLAYYYIEMWITITEIIL